MSQLNITNHARKRRKQMGVTEHRIEAALEHPDMKYPSTQDGKPCTLYQREKIVVVVDDEYGDIVTILWHGKEGRHEQA